MWYEPIQAWLQNPAIHSLVNAMIVAAFCIPLWMTITQVIRFMERTFNIGHAMLKPLDRILHSLLLLAAFIIILSLFGIGIDGLWSTVTALVATIAIGFIASWSILSNFVCTFFLIAMKPFAPGDTISIPSENVEGQIVDFTMAYTVIKDGNGFSVRIPNNLFFQKIYRTKACTEPKRTLTEQLNADDPLEP